VRFISVSADEQLSEHASRSCTAEMSSSCELTTVIVELCRKF